MKAWLNDLLALAALTSAAVSAALAARMLWDARQRRHAAARVAGSVGLPSRSWGQDLGAWAREAWARRLPSRAQQAARQWLEAQGLPGDAADQLWFQGVLIALGGFLAGLALGVGLWALAFSALGVLPWLRARDAAAQRRRRLSRSLPEALDLLSACVQAGLGLDPALQRLGQALPAGPLREELLRCLDELRLGRPRREAFVALEKRAGLRELGLVLRAILRSESRGVPLAPVLAAQSAQMRRLRSLAVQKAAAQAPVKMLLPLMGFILPVIFLVIFGPILLKLSELGF